MALAGENGIKRCLGSGDSGHPTKSSRVGLFLESKLVQHSRRFAVPQCTLLPAVQRRLPILCRLHFAQSDIGTHPSRHSAIPTGPRRFAVSWNGGAQFDK